MRLRKETILAIRESAAAALGEPEELMFQSRADTRQRTEPISEPPFGPDNGRLRSVLLKLQSIRLAIG